MLCVNLHTYYSSDRCAGIVALAPKLYACFDEVTELISVMVRDILNKTDNFDGDLLADEQKLKLSTRGVSRRQNTYTALQFLNVLKTGQPISGTNKTFLFRKNNLYLTQLVKRGVDAFFVKKYLLPCNIRTKHY